MITTKTYKLLLVGLLAFSGTTQALLDWNFFDGNGRNAEQPKKPKKHNNRILGLTGGDALLIAGGALVLARPDLATKYILPAAWNVTKFGVKNLAVPAIQNGTTIIYNNPGTSMKTLYNLAVLYGTYQTFHDAHEYIDKKIPNGPTIPQDLYTKIRNGDRLSLIDKARYNWYHDFAPKFYSARKAVLKLATYPTAVAILAASQLPFHVQS